MFKELLLKQIKQFLLEGKRLTLTIPINNAITNKIKHFPQLFALAPEIPLKLKLHQ